MPKQNQRNRPPRVPRPLSSIESHFEDQIDFLTRSSATFDAGETAEYKRLATALRVLLHDRPPMSVSVLAQLNLGGIQFIASNSVMNPRNLLGEFKLARLHVSPDGSRYVPRLDESSCLRSLPFAEWWEEPVIKLHTGELFSRRDLVLLVANQDGGAHVDPEIDEKYDKLTKSGAGWASVGMGDPIPIVELEKVSMRQIAWEVLASLTPALNRMTGNRLCLCGSGRKHRYCCGRKR